MKGILDLYEPLAHQTENFIKFQFFIDPFTHEDKPCCVAFHLLQLQQMKTTTITTKAEIECAMDEV